MLMLWAFFVGTDELHAHYRTVSAQDVMQKLVTNGGYLITRNGEPLLQFNANRLFIPASTIKISTALAALETLGPAHRIKTEFYLRNGTTLCIKGFGDPYLISERIEEIALALKKKGVRQLEKIIIDDHYFALEGPADGSENSDNPYDAINGALSVNFNSVAVSRLDDGSLVSPEPQTPMLSITEEIGFWVATGTHRLNISAYSDRNDAITPHRYAAELFAQLLRKHGVEVGTSYDRGTVVVQDRLIYTYLSKKSVAEMVRGCLKYSNNFIANQLFLYLGAIRFGPPATWDKGIRAVREVLTVSGRIAEDQFTIVEGSGLSRKNRITPAAMIRVLDLFKPYATLLPDRKGILLKSGTMTGIYGYCGYFSSAGALDPFVILLNQPVNRRDQLLNSFSEFYRDQHENP